MRKTKQQIKFEKLQKTRAIELKNKQKAIGLSSTANNLSSIMGGNKVKTYRDTYPKRQYINMKKLSGKVIHYCPLDRKPE